MKAALALLAALAACAPETPPARVGPEPDTTLLEGPIPSIRPGSVSVYEVDGRVLSYRYHGRDRTGWRFTEHEGPDGTGPVLATAWTDDRGAWVRRETAATSTWWEPHGCTLVLGDCTAREWVEREGRVAVFRRVVTASLEGDLLLGEVVISGPGGPVRSWRVETLLGPRNIPVSVVTTRPDGSRTTARLVTAPEFVD